MSHKLMKTKVKSHLCVVNDGHIKLETAQHCQLIHQRLVNTPETGLASRRLKLLRCLVQYITYFIGHGDNFAFLVPLTEARKQFSEKNIITDRVCTYSIWKLKNKPFPGLLSDINLIYSPSCNTTCVVLMS